MKDKVFIVSINDKILDVFDCVEKVYNFFRDEGVSEFMFGKKYMNFEEGIDYILETGYKEEVMIGDDHCRLSIVEKKVK